MKPSENASSEPDIQPGVSWELAEDRASRLSDIHYDLRFVIPDDIDKAIEAAVEIRFQLKEPSKALQLDFRQRPESLRSVNVNGEALDVRVEREHVILPADSLRAGANRVTLELTAGDGSMNRNPDYLYTLFVPDRARTAVPLFDQPNLKAKYRLSLEVPRGWTAMANGPLEEVNEGVESTTFQFADSDLISTYLFSFVAGRFETVTRTLDGREMTLLHRETDRNKVERNLDAIFELHAASLAWLEDYTGIAYPFQKFDVALIPAFQYGGMEHVGAIQYRASTLFLDEAPSDSQLLRRAGLIAHETAHMWFGNLVTMDWFDDVWTKEVYANFMAAKMVNPSFPDIDHDLNFLVRHYPSAYGVDRSRGANAIRQRLDNLADAGQMYGAIIYNKAPIMMRQLELLLGEGPFREGIREYLTTYSFGNATWPDLIRILDAKTETDLAAWSEVWVHTTGRPHIELDAGADGGLVLRQVDPHGRNRVWPQRFGIMAGLRPGPPVGVVSADAATSLATITGDLAETAPRELVVNADGLGYGLFPVTMPTFGQWRQWPTVTRGSTLIHLYESLLQVDRAEPERIDPEAYVDLLMEVIAGEDNQLLLNLAVGQLNRLVSSFLTPESAAARAPTIEKMLWRRMEEVDDPSRKKLLFDAYFRSASSPGAVDRVRSIWRGGAVPSGLKLGENDWIAMAETLAIRLPDQADGIVARQLETTKNPDSRRRLEFVAPSLSPDVAVRDGFFASLQDEKNRRTESWVLDGLVNLHHPSRIAESEKYILPSLELLKEIQVTGDIFFPKRWLDRTLENHRSASAAETVEQFLHRRPDYSPQLRMKVLQAADLLFRASSQRNGESNASTPASE